MNDNLDAVVNKTVTIRRNVEDTFRIWTEQIHLWWPAGHSLSKDPNTKVVLEGKLGGRFYEKTSVNEEHEFGSVFLWEPPYNLAFTWFLGSGQKLPTQIKVQFSELAENSTRVDVEHRGPEFISDLWWKNVKIYSRSMDTVLASFADFCHTD